jgi:hypothetical protein
MSSCGVIAENAVGLFPVGGDDQVLTYLFVCLELSDERLPVWEVDFGALQFETHAELFERGILGRDEHFDPAKFLGPTLFNERFRLGLTHTRGV